MPFPFASSANVLRSATVENPAPPYLAQILMTTPAFALVPVRAFSVQIRKDADRDPQADDGIDLRLVSG